MVACLIGSLSGRHSTVSVGSRHFMKKAIFKQMEGLGISIFSIIAWNVVRYYMEETPVYGRFMIGWVQSR